MQVVVKRGPKPRPKITCRTLECVQQEHALGLCNPCYQRAKRQSPEPEAREEPPVDDRRRLIATALVPARPNALVVARLVWGDRLEEKADHFRVNGGHVTFQELMKRTNLVLKGEGFRQLEAFL